MNKTHLPCLLAALLGGAFFSLSALALEISWTGQPDNYALRMEPAAIEGFGALRFGMSPAEVQERLAARFPGAVVEAIEDPVQRTTLLTADLEGLSPVEGRPSPGPATLTFIFGYRSGSLMAINLDWYAEGEASAAQRQALLDAGTAYITELLSWYWAPLQSARGHVLGPNSLLLFSGRDSQGRGVEVRIEGVALDVLLPEGGSEHHPAPGGPAQLHIGLSVMPDRPDVYRLPAGAF